MRQNKEYFEMENTMRFIGITGGVGAGKSELLRYIREHYPCEVYLADEVAHLLQEPGTECYERLVQLLGKEVLLPDERIDKKKMAAAIFADRKLLLQVNEIVHPAVRSFLLERLEEAKRRPETKLFFVEAALLIEAGYKELADELWYVYADKDIRRKRLMESRGYSSEKVEEIMEKQLSEEKFREACDFVIDNSGSLEDSLKQVSERLKEITERHGY